MRKYVFFGDSICVGQFISVSETWVSKLSRKLVEHHGEDVWVSNVSVSGNTTPMALERMVFDALSHGIDVFYTQFGINDSNFWATDLGAPRVTIDSFEANLREIIKRARLAGATKVIIGTNHPTEKTIQVGAAQVEHQVGNARYNEVVRKVARDERAILADHEAAVLAAGGAHLLEDGIHLNHRGHALYFATLLPIFTEITGS